jgi:hypothetical protein
VKEGKTEPAGQQIKRMRLYPLSQRNNPPPMNFVNASGKPATRRSWAR